MSGFVRSIKFTIPGASGAPGVEVYVEESGTGALIFNVSVLDSGALTADLRGLFFRLTDSSTAKLAGLQATSADGTVTDFQAADNKVIDLGDGANMSGAVSKTNAFDVGVEFGTEGIGKNDIQDSSFVLSNTASNLTLDDIAQTLFGARLTSVGSPTGSRDGSAKLTAVAPAAPDARDDSFSLYEDGAADLADPRSSAAGVKFAPLANDTDADGNVLTITKLLGVAEGTTVTTAKGGTVTIIDGNDADALPGDAILYTPLTDFSGTDSFQYLISDGAGGTDFATVTLSVAAVADVPDVSYEIIAGSAVNTFTIRVTATETDDDSSEFIDSLGWSVAGGLPGGATITPTSVNPGTEPNQIVQDFLVNLPIDTDSVFDIVFTAVSKETSNGDTQTGSTTVKVDYDYNRNDFDTTFYATDQSIWSTGDQFTFVDDRFLGIDESWDERVGDFAFAESNGKFKAGFQSTLTFEGGEIDGQVPYDLFVDTNYNKTTDVLVIGSGASLLNGGGFTTEGPEGSYKLDFIFDFFLHAAAGLDFGDLGSWDLISVNLGPWNINENILDLNSDDLTFTVGLPAGFSLTFAWPNVDTTSDTTNVYNSSGSSNQFFRLDVDLDDLVTAALGLPVNPFAPGFDIGVASGTLDLIDADIGLGLNFLQDFAMAVNSLSATIFYENGTSAAFTFGSDITLANASTYDVDNDGAIEFELVVDPQATLTNSTDLGFNFNWNFDLLRLSGSYDVVFDSGSFDTGAAVDLGGTIPIGSVEVFNSTFALDFASQDFVFGA